MRVLCPSHRRLPRQGPPHRLARSAAHAAGFYKLGVLYEQAEKLRTAGYARLHQTSDERSSAEAYVMLRRFCKFWEIIRREKDYQKHPEWTTLRRNMVRRGRERRVRRSGRHARLRAPTQLRRGSRPCCSAVVCGGR